jgi:acyl carrier protein
MLKSRLLNIIEDFFAQEEVNNLVKNIDNIDDKLKLLPSESMFALMLVTSIEDELDIEFEDDEIDIQFFSSIDAILEKINFHLNKEL